MRKAFKLKIYESDGQKFEDLFSEIMQMYDSRFKPTKPYGSLGDGGNDGWIPSVGEYYQVYAPENLHTSAYQASKKIKEDLDKLIDFWNDISPIKKVIFVVNDKYKGVPRHLTETIHNLNNEYEKIAIELFTASDLERIFFLLNEQQIQSIIGFSNIDSDKDRIRKYLNEFTYVFKELFDLGREAGYFFPMLSYSKINDFFSNDWLFRRILSYNHEIRKYQYKLRDSLIKMVNQIDKDPYYECIGNSFKYKIPYDIENRDQIIDDRRDSMEKYINELIDAYIHLRDYAI